jgi:hypothetical protein
LKSQRGGMVLMGLTDEPLNITPNSARDVVKTKGAIGFMNCDDPPTSPTLLASPTSPTSPTSPISPTLPTSPSKSQRGGMILMGLKNEPLNITPNSTRDSVKTKGTAGFMNRNNLSASPTSPLKSQRGGMVLMGLTDEPLNITPTSTQDMVKTKGAIGFMNCEGPPTSTLPLSPTSRTSPLIKQRPDMVLMGLTDEPLNITPNSTQDVVKTKGTTGFMNRNKSPTLPVSPLKPQRGGMVLMGLTDEPLNITPTSTQDMVKTKGAIGFINCDDPPTPPLKPQRRVLKGLTDEPLNITPNSIREMVKTKGAIGFMNCDDPPISPTSPLQSQRGGMVLMGLTDEPLNITPNSTREMVKTKGAIGFMNCLDLSTSPTSPLKSQRRGKVLMGLKNEPLNITPNSTRDVVITKDGVINCDEIFPFDDIIPISSKSSPKHTSPLYFPKGKSSIDGHIKRPLSGASPSLTKKEPWKIIETGNHDREELVSLPPKFSDTSKSFTLPNVSLPPVPQNKQTISPETSPLSGQKDRVVNNTTSPIPMGNKFNKQPGQFCSPLVSPNMHNWGLGLVAPNNESGRAMDPDATREMVREKGAIGFLTSNSDVRDAPEIQPKYSEKSRSTTTPNLTQRETNSNELRDGKEVGNLSSVQAKNIPKEKGTKEFPSPRSKSLTPNLIKKKTAGVGKIRDGNNTIVGRQQEVHPLLDKTSEDFVNSLQSEFTPIDNTVSPKKKFTKRAFLKKRGNHPVNMYQSRLDLEDRDIQKDVELDGTEKFRGNRAHGVVNLNVDSFKSVLPSPIPSSRSYNDFLTIQGDYQDKTSFGADKAQALAHGIGADSTDFIQKNLMTQNETRQMVRAKGAKGFLESDDAIQYNTAKNLDMTRQMVREKGAKGFLENKETSPQKILTDHDEKQQIVRTKGTKGFLDQGDSKQSHVTTDLDETRQMVRAKGAMGFLNLDETASRTVYDEEKIKPTNAKSKIGEERYIFKFFFLILLYHLFDLKIVCISFFPLFYFVYFDCFSNNFFQISIYIQIEIIYHYTIATTATRGHSGNQKKNRKYSIY